MGFFDWLWGGESKNECVSNDQIWLTQEAKYLAIAREILQARGAPGSANAVFVIAYLPDCLEALKQAVNYEAADDPAVIVTLASDLATLAKSGLAAGCDSAFLIVAERHLLPKHDDDIADFARSLPCKSQIKFHAALDDDVLLLYAGERVRDTLRRLGMAEDESVESRMVSRSLTQARKKIAKLALSDMPAFSAREWLKKNCPQ